MMLQNVAEALTATRSIRASCRSTHPCDPHTGRPQAFELKETCGKVVDKGELK